jgi:pectin methylesterase-like acyl-CoA thioesterase
MKVSSRRRAVVFTAAVTGLLASVGTMAAAPAQAAAGCRVDYKITSQWTGGFGGDMTVTNLGDTLNGWTLTWSFTAGQTVTQAWNATVTQSGSTATATNASYNASIGTNGSVNVGFNGSWTGMNPPPTGFTLNGTACTGGAPTPTAAPTTAPPTTTPPTTTPPTTTPSTTKPPTTTPPATTPPTTGTPTVASDGTGTYRTVQAAIDAVPANNTSRRTITIKAGTYREIVTIPSNKPYITLQGLGSAAGNTVIVNNRSNAGGYGTFGSATVFVNGHDTVMKNLTLANDYGEGSQAVAANLNADHLIFDNVRFVGNQDTLLVQAYRSYVVNSYVEGTVDFIFGDGAAVFNATSIYQKRSSGGPITAARTPAGNTYGFLIYRCTITGLANNVTQLGRPWGPNAQVLFRESNLSATMKMSQPWIDMSGNVWQNARFFEYKNTGAGATVNGNRPQMSDATAASYTPQRYLAGSDGWNPM